MSVDETKVQFATPAFEIDKIAAYSTKSDSSSPLLPNMTYSIPGSATSDPTYTLESVPNPYGKKCLPNLSWSLDGANYYDQDNILYYYSTILMQRAIQMGVSCGCSDSTIYFSFVSGFPTTQVVYLQFAVDSIT